MSGFMRKLYSPRVFDWLFGFAGLVSIGAVIPATGNAYPAVSASDNPLLKGGMLVAVLLASALFAIAAARFDQKKADDYLFIVLTRSAYVGLFTLLFTAVLWELLLAETLGGLTSQVMIGLLVASWSLGYLYTRLRGTGASS